MADQGAAPSASGQTYLGALYNLGGSMLSYATDQLNRHGLLGTQPPAWARCRV